MKQSNASGFTLIELVVAITLVGICSATILGFMSTMASRNAEVLVNQQSTTIAAAYLQEALSSSLIAKAGIRNDITDYNFPSQEVQDQQGNAIPGLSEYRVSASANQSALGTTPANSVPAGESYLVIVTVADPLNQSVSIAGYKTQH